VIDPNPVWMPYAVVLVLTALFHFAFQWIFSLDDDPSRKQGVDYIQRTIGIRVVELLLLLGGSIAIVSGVFFEANDNSKPYWTMAFGLGFAMFTGFIANTHLWLDEEGMHYRQGLGATRSIAWSNLDHYEVERQTSGDMGTFISFNFVASDKTKLSIPKQNYDMPALLRKIEAHRNIQQQPFKRQSWFADN
jgi:hypothetical protein